MLGFSSDNLLEKAKELQLSQKPYWTKLLHYENNKSIINNQKFFLSPNGKTDKEDELLKTIEKFVDTPSSTCRYPARYKWINSILDLDIKQPICRKLDKFLKPNFKKISVVFTAERYNSPSSVLGHTFVKIDTDTIPYVLNYSAKVPKGTNPFEYAYKGNFGGFQSHYEMLAFVMKDSEYRDGEFRDLIDIELSFQKDEVLNMMLHYYEIKDTEQDYYFMTRNCSSELLKLLDMAKYDLDLKGELNRVTVPIDIVYILKNHGLTKDVSKSLSKLKLFNLHVEQLNNNERKILKKILDRELRIAEFDKMKEISDEAKSLIISSGISYIEMKLVKKELPQKYTSSLLYLIQLQSKYEDLHKEEVISLDKFPISDKYHKVSLGSRSVEHQKTELVLGYRYLYRDRFDLVDAEEKHGSVELLDISLKLEDDDIKLNYLTILNLESQPISNEFFYEHTTKFKLALERLFYDEDMYTFVKYGRGYRFRLDKHFTYNFSLNAGAYYHDEDIYAISPDISLEYNLNNKFVSVIKYEYAKYSNSLHVNNIYWDNYFKLTDSTTIKAQLSYKDDVKSYSEFRLNYNINF